MSVRTNTNGEGGATEEHHAEHEGPLRSYVLGKPSNAIGFIDILIAHRVDEVGTNAYGTRTKHNSPRRQWMVHES